MKMLKEANGLARLTTFFVAGLFLLTNCGGELHIDVENEPDTGGTQAMMLTPPAEDGSLGQPLQEVVYKKIDGKYVVGGDMVVPPEQLVDIDEIDEPSRIQVREQSLSARAGEQYRWPNATVPYIIDNDVPDQDRIHQAIAQWESDTPINFVQHTDQSDYVRFVRYDDPNIGMSYVGRIGGEQEIWLGDDVNVPVVLHEIGHAVGLFHEHQRPDRDHHVTIHWDNIDSQWQYAFEKNSSTTDLSDYDHQSIMHYHSTAFSKNGQDTITYNDGQSVPTTTSLSSSDTQGIDALYDDEGSCVDDSQCASNEKCRNGTCVCVPDCTGKECGSDGCGNSCGSCGSGYTCINNSCACDSECCSDLDCDNTPTCNSWTSCTGMCPGTRERDCSSEVCSEGSCVTDSWTESESCVDCGSDEFCCDSDVCSSGGGCL